MTDANEGGRKRVAVAGSTGRAGHYAVELLTEAGHDVVPISRAEGVDLITAEGLAEALEGVEVVIDAATGPSPEAGPATEFFTTATGNLQTLGAEAGVRQIVVVSIIGTDRFQGGYGVAKIAHEQASLSGPVPARILRASQFHELVAKLIEWGDRDGAVHVPRMRTKLVASRTVAAQLVKMATAPEATNGSPPIVEIAGPREESMIEMATLLATTRGEAAPVEDAPDPEDHDARIYEEGALLPGPEAIIAGPTFEEWLGT
jgi:uncharacterized protein YbjT (DUF2867 family)